MKQQPFVAVFFSQVRRNKRRYGAHSIEPRNAQKRVEAAVTALPGLRMDLRMESEGVEGLRGRGGEQTGRGRAGRYANLNPGKWFLGWRVHLRRGFPMPSGMVRTSLIAVEKRNWKEQSR